MGFQLILALLAHLPQHGYTEPQMAWLREQGESYLRGLHDGLHGQLGVDTIPIMNGARNG